MPITFFLCGQNVTDSTIAELLVSEGNPSKVNFSKIQIPQNVTSILESIPHPNNDKEIENEGNKLLSETPPITSYHVDQSRTCLLNGDSSPTFIRKISCGSDFLLVLLNNGSLYSMGSNAHGQLGINISDFTINTFPNKQLVKVKMNGGAKLIECGAHFSLFATNDNRLFGFGTNDYNQILFDKSLNSPLSSNILEPIEIDYHREEGHDITHLACCFSFSMFVLNNYELRIIGQNWVYEHGHPNLVGSRHAPYVPLHTFQSKVKKICTGGFHFVVLLENGQLFGSGDCTSKQYGSFTGHVPEEGGIFMDMGKKYFSNCAPIMDVVCGGDSTVVQLEDGSIYFCGINNMNQFIQNFRQVEDMTPIHYNENILKLYSGEDFSCAITKEGSCILRGNNDKTQLGCAERPSIEYSFRLSELFSNRELKNLNEINIACGYYNTVIYRKPVNDIQDHFPLLSNSIKSLHDILIKH